MSRFQFYECVELYLHHIEFLPWWFIKKWRKTLVVRGVNSCFGHALILHWPCALQELYQYCMLWFVPCQFRVTGGLKDAYCTSGVNLTETLLLILLQLATISLCVIYISQPPWLTEFYTKSGWNGIYLSPVKVESTFVMRTLKSWYFCCHISVNPVLSGAWVGRKPVLSGKLLVTRILITNTCFKRNLSVMEKTRPLRFRYCQVSLYHGQKCAIWTLKFISIL